MIVPNGYIKITTKSGGGFVNGKPKRATSTTTDYIEANVNESRRLHGVVGDQTAATKSSYTALIDPESFTGRIWDGDNIWDNDDLWQAFINDWDSVEIFDSRKTSLGTFDIQSARLLDYVEIVKIEV